MKKLVWKVHLVADHVNAGGTVSGGRLFDMADVSAYTMINETFLTDSCLELVILTISRIKKPKTTEYSMEMIHKFSLKLGLA